MSGALDLRGDRVPSGRRLGASLARLELKILLEETLARYPNMALAGKPTWVESGFLNQLKSLPVRLSPR